MLLKPIASANDEAVRSVFFLFFAIFFLFFPNSTAKVTEKVQNLSSLPNFFVILHSVNDSLMKKTIYNKFNKQLIPALPVVQFEGRVVVILTKRDAARAVDYLLRQSILGVDTETRPSFRRGDNHRVSLLQVSTHDTCFLFRLNHTGLTADIVRLLEDTTVPKIGLSLGDDILSLHRIGGFTPGFFIDLQNHVKEIGIEDLSLQKLYANLFGLRISKRQQLSNWERDILDEKQKSYAAIDAWACIMLYEELQRLKETGDYILVKNEEEGVKPRT
jgi:hypothetical protein